MPKETLGDVDIHYDIVGEGTPVVMVMGFTMSGSAWRFQVPELSKKHRVVTFDNRGAGKSSQPAGPYSMAMLAEDTIALMDRLGIEQAHLVGVSMGGMVAQHVAIEHADRLLSLALIATHPGGFFMRIPPLSGLAWLSTAAVGVSRAKAAKHLLFPRSFRREVGDEWLESVLSRDFANPPSKAGRRGQLRAVMGHNTRRGLPKLGGLPSLVVRPGKDRLVAKRGSDAIHALIPDAKLLALSEAGHGIIRQSSAELNAALLEHFAAAELSRQAAGG